MKYSICFLLLFSLISCNTNCSCNSDEMRYFVRELEGYHLRTPDESEITCYEDEKIWLVKWNSPKSHMGKRQWDLIIEDDKMNPAKSIGVLEDIKKTDCDLLYDFIIYTRDRGYDIANMGISDSSSISAIIKTDEGFLMANQMYTKVENAWILDSTYSYFSGYDNNVDINKKPNTEYNP